MDTLAVLESPAYLDLLQHPTPWSARMRPSFANLQREACRTLLTMGTGVGGTLGTLQAGLPGNVPVPAWAALADACLELPGALAVHVGAQDGAVPALPWRAADAGAGSPEAAGATRLVLCFEAQQADALPALLECAAQWLARAGAMPQAGTRRAYVLAHALDAPA